MPIKDWNIEKLTGYHPKTTFYTDFSIAEPFGISAIADTYERAFKEWKNNPVYLTELAMVMNWKIWEHYETNESFAKFYNDLWTRTDAYCADNLTGKDLEYYLRTTD